VPALRIGVTDDAGPALVVRGLFTVGLDELADAHRGTLPRYFA